MGMYGEPFRPISVARSKTKRLRPALGGIMQSLCLGLETRALLEVVFYRVMWHALARSASPLFGMPLGYY